MPSPLRPLARLFAPKPRTVERETLQVELPDGRTIALQRVRMREGRLIAVGGSAAPSTD